MLASLRMLLCVVCFFGPEGDLRVLAQSAHERTALTTRGDIGRGEKIFADEKRSRCLICHKVGSKGGDAGPDLSHIGGKFDRIHLIESLLEPSRQIVEGYRATTLALTDGRVIVGVVKDSSANSLTLIDVNGVKHIVPTNDVETREESNVSLMPTGLADALNPNEFADLVAYLESLRSAAKASPGGDVTGAIELPSGFGVQVVATHLSGATALETVRDGRVLVAEQTGTLRVIKGGKLLDRPFVTLPVDSTWERGLIGVTVHPEFPQEPYVYVCYVAKAPYPHHRVSRFTADGDVAIAGSEVILFRGDDQSKTTGKVPAGHQGGALHFGHDGKLYIAIGEHTAMAPAQALDSLLGKILRINPDGSIPVDNPFLEKTSGKYRAIWARGCRNVFTFSVQPTTGTLFLNDVGGTYEEINQGAAGANYGWPTVEHGPTSVAGITGPIHIYPQASISGGDFCKVSSPWSASFHGKYFFADFVHGWIKYIDPQDAKDAQPFVSGLRRPVDLRFAHDGSMYVLLRNAWVIDGKFAGRTGTLLRITSTD